MAEKYAKTGIVREAGYMYFVTDGGIWRAKPGGEREKVVDVELEPGFVYVIDKDGDVARNIRQRDLPKPASYQKPSNKAADNSFSQWPGVKKIGWDALGDDEKIETLSESDWDIEDLFGEAPETVYRIDGNVHRKSDLQVSAEAYEYLVVNGDLTVDGLLVLDACDMANILVVNGDLRSRGLAVATDSHLYVRGETIVEGEVVFDLSDAGYASFAGQTKADAWMNMGRMPPKFCATKTEPTVLGGGALDDGCGTIKEVVARLKSGGKVIG